MSEEVRSCYTCKHFHTSPSMPPCKGCFGVQGHPHYEEAKSDTESIENMGNP